jgi:RsiW-degrading membrane proteinase PrsW (M82 family)
VNWWVVIGLFLLGACAGAMLTIVRYSAEIRKIKRLTEALARQNASETQRQKWKSASSGSG